MGMATEFIPTRIIRPRNGCADEGTSCAEGPSSLLLPDGRSALRERDTRQLDAVHRPGARISELSVVAQAAQPNVTRIWESAE